MYVDVWSICRITGKSVIRIGLVASTRLAAASSIRRSLAKAMIHGEAKI